MYGESRAEYLCRLFLRDLMIAVQREIADIPDHLFLSPLGAITKAPDSFSGHAGSVPFSNGSEKGRLLHREEAVDLDVCNADDRCYNKTRVENSLFAFQRIVFLPQFESYQALTTRPLSCPMANTIIH